MQLTKAGKEQNKKLKKQKGRLEQTETKNLPLREEPPKINYSC